MQTEDQKPDYLAELSKPENRERIINAVLLTYEQALATKVDQVFHVHPAEEFSGPTLIIGASWPHLVDVEPA